VNTGGANHVGKNRIDSCQSTLNAVSRRRQMEGVFWEFKDFGFARRHFAAFSGGREGGKYYF
jgi:hypothetical protein